MPGKAKSSWSIWLALVPICLIITVALVWFKSLQEKPAVSQLTLSFPSPSVIYVGGLSGETAKVLQDNREIAVWPAEGFEHAELSVQWQPATIYHVETSSGRKTQKTSPAEQAVLALRIHAPYGQQPTERRFLNSELESEELSPINVAVPASPQTTIDVMLELESLADQTWNVSLEGDGFPAENRELAFEFDQSIWKKKLEVGRTLPDQPFPLILHIGDSQIPIRLGLTGDRVATGDISVSEWHMPALVDGTIDQRRVQQSISLPDPTWARLSKWFGGTPQLIDFYEPYAYHGITLHNQSDSPVSLLLEVQIQSDGDWFSAPKVNTKTGTPRILGFVNLPAHASNRCVLPFYVHPETPSGSYEMHLTATPFGRDTPIADKSWTVGISRGNATYAAWLFGVVILSVTWLGVIIACWKQLTNSLGLRLIVLLTLLGSLQFCLQFAGGMLSNISYVLLGPFNCFVGGLLTEVMTYLLVAAILCLVPRVGAMTLAGIVSYVMGAMMFGSFSITDLLFIGSAIAFREIFLLTFGVTRLHPDAEYQPSFIRMSLALGLADAASTFTTLVLQTVFYRLFFADWYILLQVTITGFLYTVLGVWLGRGLGRSLRRAHP